MRRTWLRDDHIGGWVLYEVADDALPGLEAMEGTVLASVSDEVLKDRALAEALLADEHPGLPPLPGAAALAARPVHEPQDRLALTPDIYARFAAYFAVHPTWGSLHVVLDDGNYEDRCVTFCAGWAGESGDAEGAALASLLAQMTRTQRGRIAERVRAGHWPGWEDAG